MQNLKNTLKTFIGLIILSISNTASADVIVLIHGYMGSPMSWEDSMVNNRLEEAGWQRGGLIIPENQAFYPDPMRRVPSEQAKNISFVIDMPWMRPLDEQTDQLNRAMQVVLDMRPNEPITLIGHSAGALAARLWLVEYYNPAVIRLISIAAPNLGTQRANDALDLTDPIFAPIDAVRNMFGGKLYNTVRRSRTLVHDFTPPSKRNPTVLYWLNRQAHPDIEYIAIVREDRRGKDQDWLVSADSQDLNNVPVLRGKVKSYVVDQKHPLNPEDGYLLASLLAKGGAQ
jgi:pimeloyl-ACP methyl ester carboxylesterase